jgi:hypothetical protein
MATEVATLTFKADTKDIERAKAELEKLGYAGSQVDKRAQMALKKPPKNI